MGWIGRLLGGGAKGENPTASNERGAESAELSSTSSRQGASGGSYQRLEIDVGPLSGARPEAEYEEKRTERDNRRAGMDRRGGLPDRRTRDIPAKADRRKNLWNRRRKFGERRFNPDRRERGASDAPRTSERRSSPSNASRPLAQGTEDAFTPRVEAAAESLPLTQHPAQDWEQEIPLFPEDIPAAPPLPATPRAFAPPPPLEPGKFPLSASDGSAIAYARYGNEQHGGNEIDILEHDGTEERSLHFDTPDRQIHLRNGVTDHALDLPSSWPQEEALTITPYGNVTLYFSRAARGYIVLAAEKRTVNLFQAIRKKPATTTVVLNDITEVERLGPLTCRFGGVRFYFDLTQTVELRDDSGKTWRISGPSGVNNFEEYRREMSPPMEGK